MRRGGTGITRRFMPLVAVQPEQASRKAMVEGHDSPRATRTPDPWGARPGWAIQPDRGPAAACHHVRVPPSERRGSMLTPLALAERTGIVTMAHDGSDDASRVLVSDGRSVVDDPAAAGCWINMRAGGRRELPNVQVGRPGKRRIPILCTYIVHSTAKACKRPAALVFASVGTLNAVVVARLQNSSDIVVCATCFLDEGFLVLPDSWTRT